MSRLNFMEEQEMAIRTVAEELAHLEKLVLKGERIAPEIAVLFEGCIKQAARIQSAIRRHNSNLPLRNWMQKTDARATAPGKTRRSELISGVDHSHNQKG